MRVVDPARVGLLIDFGDDGGSSRMLEHIVLPTFRLIVEEMRAAKELDREIEFVVEQVKGLPEGAVKPVQDAFDRLVAADCLAIFGPYISENAAPISEHVNAVAKVPIVSIAGTESMLGEYVFGLPAGSMEEEPIIMAQIAQYDGCKTIGIIYEDSLIGEEYLRTLRQACHKAGLQITGEIAVPQVEADKVDALKVLHANNPDGIMHVGMGLGLLRVNAGLKELDWWPRRYSTTAFEFAATSETWRKELAGWIGLEQYDERNTVGRDFLDRFEARYGHRPNFYFPLVVNDVGRMILTAIATARPLTGKGVKNALERIKMMPASTGAPGTRMRFGKFIRNGWFGSEFLVARRVLDDGSAIVMHGTLEGLVPPFVEP